MCLVSECATQHQQHVSEREGSGYQAIWKEDSGAGMSDSGQLWTQGTCFFLFFFFYMKCVSSMTLSFMFVFMVLIMYVLGILRVIFFLCVILFYFMDYHLGSIAMSF